MRRLFSLGDAVAVETPYTTEALITRLVGQLGIDLRDDDAADGTEEALYMQDAVDVGTADVDFYLSQYLQSGIADNTFCQQCATFFAVRYLCLRRLNDVPESILKECERREKMLELVRTGKARLRIAKTRRAATVTNHAVDLRRANNQVRVDTNRSTGVAQDYRRRTDDAAPDGA